jgi:putative zinc finger protein
MMHEFPCHVVRARLEAFHDGEVPFSERLTIQGHLEDCVSCSLANEELIELTASLQQMVAETEESSEALHLSERVVERLGVEEQFSLTSQMNGLFQDMHLVWAGIGASVATIICLIGSASVLHAANQEQPDSLAAVISSLANPGSNANPVRLDADMLLPRPVTDSAIEMGEEGAAFALAASVSREGRVQGVSVIDPPSGGTSRVVNAMLNEAYRVQFAPAQARTGNTVAVNMVWLVTNTTVKGRHVDEDLLRRTLRAHTAPQPIGPLPIPPQAAPAAPQPQAAPMVKPTVPEEPPMLALATGGGM